MGYTQARLATLFGVHVITVWRWERGHLTPNPTQERLLAAIERALAERKLLFEKATHKFFGDGRKIAAWE